MKKTLTLLALSTALLAVSCTGIEDVRHSQGDPAATAPRADDDDDDEGDDTEEKVELSEVPEAAKKAALEAVPGLVLTGAEREVEHGQVVFSLEGTVGGEEHEVEVTPDGKVLEIEHGDDEEDGET